MIAVVLVVVGLVVVLASGGQRRQGDLEARRREREFLTREQAETDKWLRGQS